MADDFHNSSNLEGDTAFEACVRPPSEGNWTLRPTTVVHFVLPHLDGTDAEVRAGILAAVVTIFVEH